jgi:pilus assembly protein CpaE
VTVSDVRCVVVSTDPAVIAACSAAVDGAPGVDVVAAVSRNRVLGGTAPACDVLLVADAPGASAAGWAHEAVRACSHAAVVLLTEDTDVETYRTALRAGVRAVVKLPLSTAALVSGIADAVRAGGTEARPKHGAAGVVSAVAGARGGVGASAVALALAAGAQALLIDLTRSRAGLAFTLGARPDRSLADLAQAGDALAAGIETVTVEHASGLRFVAGPADPDVLDAMAPGWGSELVRELRARERASVLDIGCVVAGASREAFAAADRALVVVTPDRAAVEAARSLLLDATRWGARGDAQIVVNRWSRHAEIGLRAISRLVDAPVAAVMRDSRRAMSGYANGRLDLAQWSRTGPGASLAATMGGVKT